MILLLAALLTDGTIADQVRALQDDDIERRQRAVESLCDLGEAGLEDVRAARAEAGDAESRARLAEIQARIEADVRRRTFPGGPEVLGLKAALAARWDREREALSFTMTVMNVDAAARHLVALEGWSLSLPRWSRSTSWSRLRLEVRALRVEDDDDESGGGMGVCVSSCGGRRVPPPLLRLEPGESVLSEPLELLRGADARSLQLRPGLYEARAVYFAKKLLPGAEADLETPWVSFVVP